MTNKVEDKEILLAKIEVFDPQSIEELFLGYKEKYKGEIIFDDIKGREIW